MQPSAAEAHQEEPAGLDFFRCRLRRAAALAPAERPLEVRQLIQAIACIEQVQRLLPLSADGRPASAAPPLQTMALAFAAAAAADAAAPQPPPLASEARASLAAYRPALLHAASEAQAAAAYPAAGASSSDSTDSNSSRASTTFSSGRAAGTPGPAPRLQLPDCLPRLAALLAHYNAAVEVAERAGLALDAAAALQAYAQLAGLVRRLGAPAWQQAADRELATLWQLEQDGQQQQQPEPAQFEEPPPPLTACQLQLAAATALAKQATALLNDCRRRGRPAAAAPQQAAQLRAVAGGAAGTLLQLAPGSPKACLLAAHCVLAADGSYGGQPGAQQQALQLYQRCYELAEPQGPAASPYCAVRAVAGWLMLAAVAPSVQRGQLEAALSAFRQAEAALARCRRQRLLPAMWLQVRWRAPVHPGGSERGGKA